ncbi:hypothetical protein [Vibrio parahaemolyticus]|uniref:hypothetical protein n=1 Tax=Vibrio parahaemolyticus TaxID=670 RepID=UPI003D9C87FB|nr:hypothetical protein [Vibrio parahaemolyticus]
MKLKKSINEARRTFNDGYSVVGIMVTVLSCTNFMFSLFNLERSDVLEVVLMTYESIVFGLIDWLTFPFNVTFPWYIKNIIFLYCIMGGAYLRTSNIENQGWEAKEGTIKSAVLAFLFKKTPGPGTPVFTGRIYLTYLYSPRWLRMVMDYTLWPRYFRLEMAKPCVYISDFSGKSSFKAGYTPGSHKVFQFDRRVVFLLQLSVVLLSTFMVIIVNGFLVMP